MDLTTIYNCIKYSIETGEILNIYQCEIPEDGCLIVQDSIWDMIKNNFGNYKVIANRVVKRSD